MGILGKQLEIYMNTDSFDWKYFLEWVMRQHDFENRDILDKLIYKWPKIDFLEGVDTKGSPKEYVSEEELAECIRRMEFLKKHVADCKKDKSWKDRTSKEKEVLNRTKEICDRFVRLKRNSIHSLICHKIFDQIKNGKEVYVYIDNHDIIPQNELYMSAFINAGPEIGQPVAYYHCSILTEEMLSYDNYIFSVLREATEEERIRIRESYRPYFVEFVIPVDRFGMTQGNYNSDNRLESVISEDGWFVAKFDTTNDLQNGEGLENSSYVEGGLLTFASPPEYTKGKLVYKCMTGSSEKIKIEKSEIEVCYSQIKPNPANEINDCLEKHAADISKISVYNIGHGNFITLGNSRNKAKVVYDMGYPYNIDSHVDFDKFEAAYGPSCKAMRHIKPELVIISHWDEDHYMGAYCNNSVFNLPWIACETDEAKYINAKRILVYLWCNGNLLFVKRQRKRFSSLKVPAFAKYSDNKIPYEISLHQGYGTTDKITPINCQGIAVEIKCNTHTLLCGDIPYDCLSQDIINKNSYNYVVIPHHASEMNQRSYDSLSKMTKIEYAIICENKDAEIGNTRKNSSGASANLLKSVEQGTHCTEIKAKSNNSVHFTDDNLTTRKKFKYRLDLTGNKKITLFAHSKK